MMSNHKVRKVRFFVKDKKGKRKMITLTARR